MYACMPTQKWHTTACEQTCKRLLKHQLKHSRDFDWILPIYVGKNILRLAQR